MENIEFIKIKIPEQKRTIKMFYDLVEMAKIDKVEYLIVMTPKQFEQLKTEKMIYDKIKGEKCE